jgi:uncharacterized integral membrane protein
MASFSSVVSVLIRVVCVLNVSPVMVSYLTVRYWTLIWRVLGSNVTHICMQFFCSDTELVISGKGKTLRNEVCQVSTVIQSSY